jgi:hypothetical protein
MPKTKVSHLAKKYSDKLTAQNWDIDYSGRKFSNSKYANLTAFERWHFREMIEAAYRAGARAGSRLAGKAR